MSVKHSSRPFYSPPSGRYSHALSSRVNSPEIAQRPSAAAVAQDSRRQMGKNFPLFQLCEVERHR